MSKKNGQAVSVPEGYKMTEVGVIPEEWASIPAGTLFDIELGKMLDGEKNQGDMKPYLGNRAVQWGRIHTDFLPRMRFRPEELTRYRLEPGDLLVCEGGEVGRAAIWDAPVVECYYQKALHRLRPISSCRTGFMFHVLRWYAREDRFTKLTGQTSIAHLPKEKFENLPVPVPPLPEQRAIATALTDTDDLIESLERLIAKKRRIKEGAMGELLSGERRLEGFEGEWEETKLAQIAPLQRGFDLPQSRVRQGKHPVVFSNGVLAYHDEAPVTGPGVITGRSGTIGKVHFVEHDYWPHNTTLWVTEFFDNEPRFVYYLYQNVDFSRFSTGSGVPTLNRNDIHNFSVRVPAVGEQRAIATLLTDMDREIEALEGKVAKVRRVKEGMMGELLGGRVRLV